MTERKGERKHDKLTQRTQFSAFFFFSLSFFFFSPFSFSFSFVDGVTCLLAFEVLNGVAGVAFVVAFDFFVTRLEVFSSSDESSDCSASEFPSAGVSGII